MKNPTNRREALKKLSLGTAAFAGLPMMTTNDQPAHPGVRDVLDSVKITDISFFTLEFPNATPLTWNG